MLGEEIVKKIKCIRTQYTRERQKARRSKGGSGGDAYVPKWVHYGNLAFLDEHCIPKQSGLNFKVSFCALKCRGGQRVRGEGHGVGCSSPCQ